MKCYLCGSNDYKKREGEVRDNKNLQILECNNCSLVFLSSIKHIHENYYEESNMSECFNVEEWLNESYIDDHKRFEFLKDMIINKNIMDFGSGAGGFLIKAKELAKKVIGVELDNKIIEHYNKNGIEHSSNLSSLQESSYDVITAFHVLEHLSEPKEILETLISKLKKNGKLIIEVPNSNDALLTVYKNEAFSKFTYWSPHLYLYNTKSLNLLFQSLDVRVDYIKHIQRYPLSNHLHWLTHNKPGGHQEWGNFLDSPELTKAYESQLASINATDTIIAQLIKT